MTRAAIGLGSNLSHRLTHLQTAVTALASVGELVAVSSLYESAPVGGPRQDPYLNAVVVLETDLPAAELWGRLQETEAAAGRSRDLHWGPRTLDLDLLIYGEERLETAQLVVPHPRAGGRRFVLEPLAEVWPEARLHEGSARGLLETVADQDVRLLARDWAQGVPDLIERGTAWVIGQGLFLTLWLGVMVASARSVDLRRASTWFALVGVVGGLGLAGASWRALGRALTPLPAPSRGGHLVETGPYRLVRHPMYTGLVLLLTGSAALFRAWPALGVAAAAMGFLAAKAVSEERRLELVYPGYEAYRERVSRRLLPWLW